MPMTETLLVKQLVASREIPESVVGWPGPGDIMKGLICSCENTSGEMGPLRMTVTPASKREICWYKLQVESKLSYDEQVERTHKVDREGHSDYR